MQRIIVLLFVILALTLSAHAESRYVTDQILVALRPAQNDTAPPLEYLATGMRVEVIKDLGTFLKIKSAADTIGFARSKYFLATPPAGATAAIADVQEQLTAALQRNAELTAEVQRLKSTPTDPANPEGSQEKKSRTETAVLLQERDQLKQEVARLKEANKNNVTTLIPAGSQLPWVLAGAAILLLGWFAGKSSRSKKRRF